MCPCVSNLCFRLVMQAGTSCTISEFLLEQSSPAVQIVTMLVQGGGPVRDHGGHNGHTGAGTGHGHGGRVPPAARDAAEDVQCPDAPSEPPNRLHLLCGGPHVGRLLGQSAGESGNEVCQHYPGRGDFGAIKLVAWGDDVSTDLI